MVYMNHLRNQNIQWMVEYFLSLFQLPYNDFYVFLHPLSKTQGHYFFCVPHKLFPWLLVIFTRLVSFLGTLWPQVVLDHPTLHR